MPALSALSTLPPPAGSAAPPGKSADPSADPLSDLLSDPFSGPLFDPLSGAAIGRVQAIALRSHAREAIRAVDTVAADAGVGLAGDRHADALSPRQVLLAGAPAYARHGLAPHTLRENLLLDIGTSHFVSGTLLRVGAQAVLWLTFGCEACGYLDARRPGIAAAIGRERGMLARVLRGGAIRVGDPVVRLPDRGAAPLAASLPGRLPAWSDDWRERVAAVLARVPPGMVVEYGQLARLAGVQPVYCRAFPRLARSLGFGHAAVAARGQPGMPRWQGHGLFDAGPVGPAAAPVSFGDE